MKQWPKKGSIVHVVGAAGVGMNGMAQVLQAKGYRVTASDRLRDRHGMTSLLSALMDQGIVFYPQDGSGITTETAGVVISSAIEPDNADLRVAEACALPVWHRAEALAEVIGGDSCIAVAGTSGKTTVTGWLAWTLTELGLNPNVVNGGGILNWKQASHPGNVRITGSTSWVVEVDESDRSLLYFHPAWAVITNVSRDHFALDETIALFERFATHVRNGIVTEAHVAGLLNTSGSPARLLVADEVPSESIQLPVHLPGKHNQANARLVIAMCELLGYGRAEIISALTGFLGIERRLESVGSRHDIVVYDDYAHNPAKIEAAWEALAARHARVLGIWRPHGFGPLAALADELEALFRVLASPPHRLYMMPVYYAGGTAAKTLTSEMFVSRLNRAGIPIVYETQYASLASRILQEAAPGDAVLVMGARDPYLPEFACSLVEGLQAMWPE